MFRRSVVLAIVGLVAASACSSGSGHSAAAFCKELQNAQNFNLNFDPNSGPQPTKDQLASVDDEVKKLRGLAPTAQLQAALDAYDNALKVGEQTGDVSGVLRLSADPNMVAFGTYETTQCHIQTDNSSGSATTLPADSGTTASLPQGPLAQAACVLLQPGEVSAFAGGAAAGTASVSGTNACAYQVPVGKATLIVQSEFITDSFFLPNTNIDSSIVPEPSLGDHGALVTSKAGLYDCFGGKVGKWFEVSLGGGSTTNGPEPWKPTTPAQRAAFLTLCKAAAARA
jgi:hypothetical protein